MEAIVSSGFNTMSVVSNPFSGKVSFTEMGMVEGGERFSVRYLVCECVCAYMMCLSCVGACVIVCCGSTCIHVIDKV